MCRTGKVTELIALLDESKSTYEALATLRSALLRKWTSAANQTIEQLGRVKALFTHFQSLLELVQANDLFKARTELDTMSGVVRDIERSVKVFPWSLPFPISIFPDLVSVGDAMISGSPLPETSVTPTR